MTLTFVGTTAGGGPASITYPAGVLAGDFVHLQVHSPVDVSGFTPVRTSSETSSRDLYRIATGSDPTPNLSLPWRVTVWRHSRGCSLGWVGASVETVNPTTVTVSAPTDRPGQLVWTFAGNDSAGTSAFSVAAGGMTARHFNQRISDVHHTIASLDEWVTSSPTRTATVTKNSTALRIYHRPFYIVPKNEAPHAPALKFPTANKVVNVGEAHRFSHEFSDPDPTDVQSQFSYRWRLVTDGTWPAGQTITVASPNQFYDFPANSFATGDYEWQAKTWDPGGLESSWSSSGLFKVATQPAGPIITDPVNGSTISTANKTVTWSVTNQDRFEVRTVAHINGAADPSVVHWTSGVTALANARSITVPFPVNNRTEHVQVRVEHGALWSTWASVQVAVSYTRPKVPSVTSNTANTPGAIQVIATHPTPTNYDTTVNRMDIYRRRVGGSEAKRIAANVPPTIAYDDWAVTHGVAYEHRVEAFANNGTSQVSAWSESGEGAPLLFSVHPANTTIEDNTAATFTWSTDGGVAPVRYDVWTDAGEGPALAASSVTSPWTSRLLQDYETGTQFWVVATDNVGATATSNRATVTVNPAPVAAPTNSVAPTITSANLNVGTTATANEGTWTGAARYAYQWLRAGVPITSATEKTYVFATADATHNISVEVYASNDGGTTKATSAAVGPIVAGTAAVISAVGTGALAATTHGTNLVVNYPTGTAADDVALIPIVSRYVGQVPPTINAPLGASLVAKVSRDSQHLFLYAKKVGAETSLTFSTAETSSAVLAGFVRVLRGASSTQFGTPVAVASSTSSTTSPTGSINIGHVDGWAVHFVASNDNNDVAVSTANSFTQLAGGVGYSTTTGNRTAMGLAEWNAPPTGSVALPVWSQAINGPDPWTMIAVEAIPAGSGGGGGVAVWPETVDHGPASFTVARTVNVTSAAALQTALTNAAAGDDIVIAAGTYTGTWDITATLTSRARVRAADGATVTLQSNGNYVLFLRNARFWTIGSTAGTLICDGASRGRAAVAVGVVSGTKESNTTNGTGGPCRDIWLHNLEVRNSGYQAIRVAFDSYDIDITDCDLHDAGKIDYGEGIYLGSASGTADQTHDVRIRGCDIHHLNAEALDAKPNTYNVVVGGCLLHDITLATTLNTKGAIAFRSPGSGFVVRNTRIWAMREVNAGDEAYGIYATGPFTMTNSMIWDCAREAVRCNPASATTVRLTHCTFWGNDTKATTTDDTVRINGNTSLTVDACIYPTGTVASTATVTKSAAVVAGDFEGPLTGAAKTTYAGDGFTLAAASTSVNAVAASSTSDLRAVPRPQGTNAERGAIERVA